MDDRYLTTQLIAYIGNKRALIPFLKDVFIDLDKQHPVTRFSDPFAGSGAVSRLGKALGFSVLANDWETYSYIINSCHIGVDKSKIDGMFLANGGVEAVFEGLQGLPPLKTGYISTYFAPDSTERADYRRERLFYTRENGIFIDTVREGIEDLYPGWDLSPVQLREKQVLLAALLYQAATHANTSGVFKAYHKGFGGHGGDALSRITRPMQLQQPVLIDGAGPCFVTAMDAAEAVAGKSFDLCYLDPPYNQHQYGSNYHLLNTIAKWDKPDQPLTLDPDGSLANKGGIRKDWKLTRSDFCYRNKSVPAFRKLLDGIDARYIVLSYNTEGIMPYEEMLAILSERGNVRLYSSEYVTYRGGRQSISRKTHNVEFLLVCNTAEPVKSGSKAAISRFLLENKLRSLMRNPFYPEKITRVFPCSNEKVRLFGSFLVLPMEHYLYFSGFPEKGELDKLTDEQLCSVYNDLASCVIENKFEECSVLLAILDNCRVERDNKIKSLERRFVRAYRKIAHKKYITKYQEITRRIDVRKLIFFQSEVDRIHEIAEKRFKG